MTSSANIKSVTGVLNAAFKTWNGTVRAALKTWGEQQVTGDPYWANVVLLAINDNKADTTTSFADQSSIARTLTAFGNAQYSTAQAATGMTSSGAFDGVGDWVQAADSTDWDFGTADFAIDGFVKLNAVGEKTYTAILGPNPTPGGNWGVYYRNSDKVFMFYDSVGLRFSTGVLSTSAFVHFAVSKTSGNMEHYIDGTRVYNAANATSIDDAAQNLRLGADNTSTNNGLNGWLNSVRITKGSNRGFTGATITVPTLPLPTS